MQTIPMRLAEHLTTGEAAKFTNKQKAAFWYGVICTLAELGDVEEAARVARTLKVDLEKLYS